MILATHLHAEDIDLSAVPEDIPEQIVTIQWLVDELAPGATTRTAMVFDVPEGWHTYWNGRNDTGFPASMNFQLPAGMALVDTTWPAPKRYVSPGDILDHVYTGTYPLFVDATWDPDVPVPAEGSVDVTCIIDWLVCREACIFESDTLMVTVPVGHDAGTAGNSGGVAQSGSKTQSGGMAQSGSAGDSGGAGDDGMTADADANHPSPSGKHADRLRELKTTFEPRLPVPAKAGEVTHQWSAGTQKDQQEASSETAPSVVELSVPGATRVEFYPKDEGTRLLLPLTDGSSKGHKLRLRTEIDTEPLVGVLAAFDSAGNARYLDVRIPRP